MKKWAKFLCCFALLGAFLVGGLAGCGTVSDIKNKSSELIYNGNAATLVEANEGNFLYFANAFSSTAPTNKDEYSSAKQNSYLARINNSKLEAKNAYFSPKDVKNVSDEVAGYDAGFMFVLGQNIYYATPNTQKVVTETDGKKDEAYHFEYTCFFKSSLNGDNKKKLYTTTGEISNLEVLKSGDTYFLVMLAGQNLVTINLSNDKVQTLATDVTSVALPKTYQKNLLGSTLDWNGQIYFTTARKNEYGSGNTSNVVKSISVSSTNPEDAKTIYSQNNATLFARERDVVFFTDKVDNAQTAVYMVDLAGDANGAFMPTSDRRYTILEGNDISTNTVTDLHLVTRDGKPQGYVFKESSTFKYFVPKNQKKGSFTFADENGDTLDMSTATILFVSGRTMYLATSTGLYRSDLSKIFTGEELVVKCDQFAEMTGISTAANFSFDGEYLYFYATLQEVPENLQDKDESTEGEEDEETEETDENLYLHRAKVTSQVTEDFKGQFELLGKTIIESRRTK